MTAEAGSEGQARGEVVVWSRQRCLLSGGDSARGGRRRARPLGHAEQKDLGLFRQKPLKSCRQVSITD